MIENSSDIEELSSPSHFDLQFHRSGTFYLAGTDEVGRGPLAGPVVSATALLLVRDGVSTEEFLILLERLEKVGVCDSKKISKIKRKKILKSLHIDVGELGGFSDLNYLNLKSSIQFIYTIGSVSEKIIDEINILNASLKSMKDSFEDLYDKFIDVEIGGALLVDGNKLPHISKNNVRVMPIIKGDSKSILIGLASIIAKEYRDNLMEKMALIYPEYGFEGHAGYPTKSHKEAIKKVGISPIHRKTFRGVKEFVPLNG